VTKVTATISQTKVTAGITQLNVEAAISQSLVTAGIDRTVVVPTITVGADKDVLTINEAIALATDNYTIIIDAGTYNESLDLTTKKLNFVGLGVLETIIYYQNLSTASASTVNIGKNCTFTNIIFDKIVTGSADNPVVNISACNPVFTDCIIRHEGDQNQVQNLVTIADASHVVMTDCIIEGWNFGNAVTITDTSTLNFTGTKFKAKLLVEDSAVTNIDTDTFYTDSTNNRLGLEASDNTEVYLKINTREIHWNYATNSEYPTGAYGGSSYKLSGNSYLELSGNQITGSTRISGSGVIVLYKDIVSTLGRFWCETSGNDGTALVTFDNCQIVMDWDNDVIGSHIIEEVVGAEIRIINGSVLEFSGHNGNWFTMGNPITCKGKLYIRDSSIIDNCNDNIPYGVNYPQAIKMTDSIIDIEDCTITNQNWDGVGTNSLLAFWKLPGGHININLKNVIFNNSEINSVPFGYLNFGDPLDGDDYICQEGLTNNSTADIFNPMADWVTLTGNCP